MGDKRIGDRPRLFGTDGIRGTANVEPMTSETVVRLGRAIAHVVKREPRRHKIIIGKDTRLSGLHAGERAHLGHLLDGGRRAAGRPAADAGHRLPHPQHARRRRRGHLGLAQSRFRTTASSSSPSSGFKLPDERRARDRAIWCSATRSRTCGRPPQEVGKAFRIDDALGRYNVFLKSTFPRASARSTA